MPTCNCAVARVIHPLLYSTAVITNTKPSEEAKTMETTKIPMDGRSQTGVRVAVLTHVLMQHRLSLLEEVASHIAQFRVFISSNYDEAHHFPVSRGTLNVTVQRSLNWTHRFYNRNGYADVSYINVPYDTFFQLLCYRPELIISTECGVRSVLSILYRCLHPSTSVILWAQVSEHTETARGWLRRSIRWWMFRNVDAVYVNGKSGEAYIRSLGFTGGVYTVPYTIDEGLFQTSAYAPDTRVRRLLYTGQLIERKGLRGFCKVLSRWCADHSETRVVFRIVGDGPERAALESIQLPRNLILEMLPAMPQNKLAEQYRQADIYAFPTLGDEWGVVVNEAMIAGLPVLGSDLGQAASELIKPGVSGWLFSPGDEQSLYEALGQALTADSETLHAMSQNARQSVADIAPRIVAENMVRAIEYTCQVPKRPQGSALASTAE
jgi:glycosyltransferase involved in cell wall biosynthesis